MNGDSGNNQINRKLVQALTDHTHNVNYIRCTVDSLHENAEKQELIKFLDANENLRISEIETKVLEISHKLYNYKSG